MKAKGKNIVTISTIIFLFILTGFTLKTQAVELDKKIQTYAGNGSECFYDIITTPDGGYVVVGNSSSTNIEKIENKGSDDSIIVKYNEEGDVMWQKGYGGSRYDEFKSITNSPDGGYVVVGSSYSTDIEGITNKGRVDAIIVKYDAEGNVMWQKGYGGSDNDEFKSITNSPDGGYVVVGSSYSTDIKGITNNGGVDAIIVKYREDGSIEWQKNYGGNENDAFNDIKNLPNGEYIVVGYSSSTDIAGLTNNGESDAIIVKYNEEGEIKSQENYGGNGYGEFTAITSLPDGGYATVGYSDSTDIKGITNNGGVDAIIVKYSKDGTIEWQKNYVNSHEEDDIFYDIIYDGEYFIVIGYQLNSVGPQSITNNYNSNSNFGAMIVKYNDEGQVIWNGALDDDPYVHFYSVIQKNDKKYVTVGWECFFQGDGVLLTITEIYNINVDNLEKGKVTVPNNSKVGANVEIEIIPDKGFKLKNITVQNEKSKTIKVNNDGEKYSFIMPASDVTVNATFEKETYIFTSETKPEYIKNSNSKELTFTCTGDLSLLTNVYINNKELSSKNYTLISGSTVITLKNEYMESLENGEYELKLTYSNGEEVTTNFVVKNKEENTKVETPIQDNKEEQTNEKVLDNTPKTGDRIFIVVSILVITILLKIFYSIMSKKRKN